MSTTTAIKIRASIATLAAAFALSVASASVATALPNDTTAPTGNSGTAQPGSTEKKKEREGTGNNSGANASVCQGLRERLATAYRTADLLRQSGADSEGLKGIYEQIAILEGQARQAGC